MKIINSTILLCSIFVVFFSCKEDKKVKSGTLQMKKVMAIHDEVMPEMGTIGKLVSDLGVIENDTSEIGLKYKEARIELQDAHKSMMDWMKDFGNRFDSDEILNGKKLTEQKQEWLDEEEKKVNALKEQINQSIEKAQQLMQKE